MLFKLLLLYSCIYSFYFIGQISTIKLKEITNLSIKFLTTSESILIGLFIFGSYVFIFNFFYNINSYEFLFISVILFFFIIYQFKNYKFYKKQLKSILIFTLISFPIILSMEPGYDAGLYHVANQQFIREEKIVFGLARLHYGLGFSSFYEYLTAPLWINNNLINLANIQLIFYIVLFLYIYEISKIDSEKNSYALLSLFTIPFWLRYADIKWGLVDFPFGVVFFLSIFTSIILFKIKNEKKIKHLFSFFIILNCLTFFLKPGGFVICFLTIFTCYILVKRNIYNATSLTKILLFPSLIVFFWLIKGFISTSCFLYPFSFTCLETSWGSPSESNFNWIKIQDWGQVIFEVIEKNLTISTELIFILLGVILIIFIFFHNKLTKINFNFNVKYFYYILTTLFLIQLIIFNMNGDFSRDQISYNKIIFEIICLIATFLMYYLIILFFLGFEKINKIIIDANFFIFIFSLFVISLWIINAPIPRLGFSFIGSLFISFLFFLKKDFFSNLIKKKNNFLIKLFLILITLNYSFLLDINFKKLGYNNYSIPYVKTINRVGFGTKPINGDQCWAELWCSPLEPYPLKLKKNNGYLFLYID